MTVQWVCTDIVLVAMFDRTFLPVYLTASLQRARQEPFRLWPFRVTEHSYRVQLTPARIVQGRGVHAILACSPGNRVLTCSQAQPKEKHSLGENPRGHSFTCVVLIPASCTAFVLSFFFWHHSSNQCHRNMYKSMVNCHNKSPHQRPPSCFYGSAEAGGSSPCNIQTLTELQSSGIALLAIRRCSIHWIWPSQKSRGLSRESHFSLLNQH